MLIGSIGVQVATALAYGLFADIGVIGTSTLRMVISAIIMIAIFRPSLSAPSARAWIGILLFGISMAGSNILLYLAIDRIPMGIATTIDFLGPCLVALAASRHLREGLLALLAFAGVALIAGLGGPLDGLGVLFAALAGAAFALYTLLAARIGKSESSMQNLALSVAVGAVLTLPFSIPAIPRVEPVHWLPLVLSALLGTTLAFTVDTLAGKLTSARVIGVLFAFDPTLATLIGAVWLGQDLTLPALLGIGMVIAAGAGIVWFAGKRENETAEGVNRMKPIESFEVERKYEVADDSAMPDAAAFSAAGLRLGASERIELEAHYFDTPDLALAARRFAVRMRRGGKDEGWHLKEKGEGGTRELHWPLSESMPQGLCDELAARVSPSTAASVAPIAILRTVRVITRVGDASGLDAVELADDRVDATNRLTGSNQIWREWEAELLPGGSEAHLDLIEPLLVTAGAKRVEGTSKIQRTMRG